MLILHYHLFKNAGTSVDQMLKKNFGDKWDHAEFRGPGAGKTTNKPLVEAHLKERPHLLAFSSHTALLPLPEIDQPVFPIFFIRHPIDRVKSAYSFERRQVADTHGARLAKEQDFAGYIRHLLDDPRQRQARNFQTSRLACNEPPDKGTELQRALRALDALPFVGSVEEYDKSVLRLQERLAEASPGFKAMVVHANKTQAPNESLTQRLEVIEDFIGTKLYTAMLDANADDLVLFEKVRALYQTTPSGT